MSHEFLGKAEIVIEHPETLCSVTFEKDCQYDAYCEGGGVVLSLQRLGSAHEHQAARVHLHGSLLAEILRRLARNVSLSSLESEHRDMLRRALVELDSALAASAPECDLPTVTDDLTPEQAVRLIHILE